MKLQDLGFNDELEKYIKEHPLGEFEIGRVIAEHRDRYVIKCASGEYEAEITGIMRFTAKNREDFPAVGDWVALQTYEHNFGIIHHVLPRFSVIKRKAVGQFGEVQIIGTNIDYGFLVQTVERDFNINRLERYLTLCYASKVKPIIVLSKTDLIDATRLEEIIDEIKTRIEDVPIVAISNETLQGYLALKSIIEKGKTYCLLGSSGVGKSTLLNNLCGNALMKTGEISSSTNKGKHVTSHRELMVLEDGGILIDNPGMREVGIADAGAGLETTFDKILDLAKQCKFKDCGHTAELGCAVLEGLDKGIIDQSSYQNFLKMERENERFELSVAEKRKKDKSFGKLMKNYKKDVNRKQ